MKKLLFLLVTIFCTAGLLGDALIQKTLDNGMEVVVKENRSNSSVGLYCFVKTGSIDEVEYMGKGLSHYLEHIVSSGTTSKHSEAWYQNKQKEIGAMTNAYTTFGATAYHMQADKKFTDDALAMLSENIMYCSLDSAELVREKDVIIKEFVYRVSPPMAQLNNRMREVTFQKSNVKNEVIGYVDIYKNNTREDMLSYYNKRYMPNNMVFVAVGDFNAEEMMVKIENTFKDYKRGVLIPITHPEESVRPGNLKYVDEFAVKQPRVYISRIVPQADYEDFAALKMAASILFEKRNSPVQYKLVEEEKIVNWVYGYFNEGGHFPVPMLQYIFEAKDVSQLDNVVKRIDEVVAEITAQGVTQKQIDEVISRTKAQKILKTPTAAQDAERIGWNMMTYGVPEIYEAKMTQMEKLTPQDINRVLRKYFIPDNRVVFYGVPMGEKKSIAESGQKVVKSEVERVELDDDLVLLHKQNTTAPVINGEIFLPISSDYETLENVGSFQFLLDMMTNGGTKDYSSMDLSGWFEDHATYVRANVGPTGVYIAFKCIKDDYQELMERILDMLNNPVFAEEELALAKDRADASYQRGLSSPDREYDEFRASVLYKGQKAGVTAKEKNDIIQKISRKQLIALRKKYFKAESALVTLFGDLTLAEAKEYAEDFRDEMPEGEIDGKKISLVVPKIDDTFVNECEFEQVNVVLNFQAPKQGDTDYYAMKVLNQVLANGFSGRLVQATRVTNNLAYGAYSYYADAKDYGFFRIASSTSILKKDELVKVLKNEVTKLINGELEQNEIELSVASYDKMLDSYFTDDKLVGTMTNYESKGLGYNFLKESIKELKKVTPEMVQNVAKKYLSDAAVIISQPSKDVKRIIE